MVLEKGRGYVARGCAWRKFVPCRHEKHALTPAERCISAFHHRQRPAGLGEEKDHDEKACNG
ncbi:MAG: hypothetical protein ACOVNK_06905, partial [Sphingorhabdus lacus]